jgi:hypothetical protein
MVKVDMTDEDVERFKDFCQYYDDFCTLLRGGAFLKENGQTIINRDKKGLIQEVKRYSTTFKRKKDEII